MILVFLVLMVCRAESNIFPIFSSNRNGADNLEHFKVQKVKRVIKANLENLVHVAPRVDEA